MRGPPRVTWGPVPDGDVRATPWDTLYMSCRRYDYFYSESLKVLRRYCRDGSYTAIKVVKKPDEEDVSRRFSDAIRSRGDKVISHEPAPW